MVSCLNVYNAYFFRWTCWGEGKPEDAKEQLISEQTNISLIAALVMTVASAFLLNLITPSEKAVTNFPSADDNDVNWWMVNLFTLAMTGLLISTFLSVRVVSWCCVLVV